jgi:hypothetical protein
VGRFSRQQIEAMVYVSTIKRQCTEGLAFCEWMRQDVASAVPAHHQEDVQTMADSAARKYPHEVIKFSGSDYHFAMLYLMKPSNWANDALILAFCGRLCVGSRSMRVIGVANARSASIRGPRQARSSSAPWTWPPRARPEIKQRAVDLATEGKTLLMPVNIDNVHWCGVIVDLKLKRILYYDPMNAKNFKTALDHLSWDLARALSVPGGTGDFDVVCVNAPILQDGYNCGFFVCLKFWRIIDPTVSLDMTERGLFVFRFRMMYFILTGSSL